MKTTKPILYRATPYLWTALIPAGTRIHPASNLPSTKPKRYWVESWAGMTMEEESWNRNYGFLIDETEL